jgi:hypothetical protein
MPFKRTGDHARPLLESEIRGAQLISISAADAARKLNVSYNTYKKWAKKYGIFDSFKNSSGKNVKKTHKNPNKGKYPLADILAGYYPTFPTFRLKKKLFSSGYKKEECECCGFGEKRVSDNSIPLLLNYIDGNIKNKSLENLEILCYNCTYLSGRGYVSRGKSEFHNPDNFQKEPFYYRAVPKVDLKETETELVDIDLDDLSDDEINQIMNG